MSKIKYCIDKVEFNKTNTQNLILVISGWVLEEQGQAVKISLSEEVPYRLMTYAREDLKEVFPEVVNTLEAGFQLEIVVTKKIKKIACQFSADEKQEVYNIEIAKLAKEKGISAKYSVKNVEEWIRNVLFAGNYNEKIFYTIDGIYPMGEQKKVSLEGWAFATDRNTKVDAEVEDKEVNVCKRLDVYQTYKDTHVLKSDCGYEITLNEDELIRKGLILKFDSEEFCSIEVVLPWEVIKNIMPKTEVQLGEKRSLKQQFEEYVKYMKDAQVYGKNGAKLKKREYDIFLEENRKNTQPYRYEETVIPQEWIDMQKVKSTISIIIAETDWQHKKGYVENMLESLRKQIYYNFEVVIVAEDEISFPENDILNIKLVRTNLADKKEKLLEGLAQAQGKYVLFMDQEDLLDSSFLACIIEDINEKEETECIFADYDIIQNNQHLVKVERDEQFFSKENANMILTACVIKKSVISGVKSYAQLVEKVKKLNSVSIYHEQRIGYHYNAVADSFSHEKTKLIAFYLTQYHITEENNKWWGEGFTEWTNVKRGEPMFEGHNQPRVPSELGYYDLVEDRSIQYKQIELAKKYDIYGFCYYYYWFEGKRLLREPLDQFLENKDLNMPYCICWANETWSKRWDGQEHEVLMQQVHNRKTDVQYIKEMIPMFKDDRYIKIDGKPLILIYRIELFPEPYKTIKRWKKICRENGIDDIHVAIVQSFGVINPEIYGADSAVEFPPHKIVGNRINEKVLSEDSDFTGNIYSYAEIVDNLSTISGREYSMMVGSMLEWDNTARRMNASNIFTEFTPDLFKKWLIKNHYFTKIYREDNVMFINAWNEWAEGTYLEPDEKYGRTFLEISKEVVDYK